MKDHPRWTVRPEDGCSNPSETPVIIIIIFINCNWVVTRWQWLCYMYTRHEIGY